MYLIAGLGNIGREYEGTRHNCGFEVIDLLSEKVGIKVNKIKYKGLIGEGTIEGEKVILLKPSTYMNLSGESVIEPVNFYKIPIENVIVIYDEMALDVGRIRIRPSGSDGGHNGMKSIIHNLNSDAFPRIRIGIGSSNGNAVSHVLGKFTEDERKIVNKAENTAADAVIEIIKNNVENAMNMYNSYKACEE